MSPLAANRGEKAIGLAISKLQYRNQRRIRERDISAVPNRLRGAPSGVSVLRSPSLWHRSSPTVRRSTPSPGPAPASPRLRMANILYVDDEPTIGLLLEDTL